MSIFASRKDILCSDIQTVYDNLLRGASGRTTYAKTWSGIGSTSCAMLITQIPSLKSQFEKMRNMFNEIAEIHTKLAQEEERSAEDCRDIIERFAVLYRIGEEYQERKEQYIRATKNLEEAHKKIEVESNKPNYEKNRAKLEQRLEEAKKEKTDALRRIKRKVHQLYTSKELYNKFKVRRMRECWTRYNEALKVAAQSEIRKLTELRDLLQSLNSKNPEAATAIEATIESAMENVQPPKPVEIPHEEEIEETKEIYEPNEIEETKEADEPSAVEEEEQKMEEAPQEINENIDANAPPLFDDFE
ncbi:hypothetical protein GPJ56_002347 [Histomonas meleagridis]|uniref:uncharacterized protein n=1 Tax=Histomonas meleagridis TaxID=135588 RepID=UPI00355996FD|nr:hypothetical protein GPJ56_002347 [Histomonas meleagridis]KAH0804606.1 hypothetical protein GO595_003436 [Histomonas meleagridis]